MRTKARLILKSLADLPADALAFAVSAPERALAATKTALAPPARLTRRQIRAARRRSAEIMNTIKSHSLAPLSNFHPWLRGGLNE